MRNIVSRQIKMYGFIVWNLADKYEEQFYKEVPERIANGAFKLKEDLKYSLEKTIEAILDVQTGRNNGKSVIIVAQE